MSRDGQERTERFAGLSNRDQPAQLTHWESPDLLNVEFYEGLAAKRLGYERLNSRPLKDCSVWMNGSDDYLRIPNNSAYTLSGNSRHFGITVELTTQLTALTYTIPIAKKGYGTGANLEWELYYGRIGAGTDAGWIFRFYDTVMGTSDLCSIIDGTIYAPPSNEVRKIEFNRNQLEVFDEDGTSIGTDTSTNTPPNWIASAEPIYIGVGVATQDVPDGNYREFHWQNFTYGDYNFASGNNIDGIEFGQAYALNFLGATWSAEYVHREWPAKYAKALRGSEYYQLVGYWQGDDGTGKRVLDRVNDNHAEAGNSGPEWVFDEAKVFGGSGLRFFGRQGAAVAQFNSADIDSLFEPVSGTPGVWHTYFIWTPEADPSETTIRDQTLWWTGTGAVNPAPFGMKVVSDTLTFSYHDGTTKWDATASTAFQWKDQTVGVYAFYNPFGTAHVIGLRVFDLSNGRPLALDDTVLTGVTAPTTTRSTDWSIGSSLSSFNAPFTYTGVATGVIDDFRVYRQLQGVPPGYLNQVFQQEQTVGTAPTGLELVAYLRFNEGAGSALTQDGTFSCSPFLYPQDQAGFSWSRGLLTPDTPAKGRLLYDYRRFSQGASRITQRRMVAVTGCTVSEVDYSTGDVTVIGGGIEKGGILSAASYGDDLYIASQNGGRPFRLSGSDLGLLGIEAPVAPTHSISYGAGLGAFAAGTYQIWYTFYNANSSGESNPSPAQEVTVLANARITDLSVPISGDPQVTGRRVYMSLVGVTGVGYLIHDEPNNATTNLSGLTIDDVSSSAAALEFTANGEAPAGGVVGVFQDYLFIGGNQQYPTRLYFSQAGDPEAWAPLDYLVLDNDSGDPITTMKPRLEVMQVYTRDSFWSVWPTGLASAPMNARQANSSYGATSVDGVLEVGKDHIVVGERNIYRTDGTTTVSVSSPPRTPPGQPSPSIQTLLREDINDSLRDGVTSAMYRSKDQVWIGMPTSTATQNDIVLVYDLTRGVWSKYDIPVDYIQEVEDADDSSQLFALTRGFVCELDKGAFDGMTASDTFTAVSGGNTYLTVAGSDAGITNDLVGLKGFLYRPGTPGTVTELEIAFTDGTSAGTGLNIFFTTTPTIQTGDILAVGAVPWFIDFVVGASKGTVEKRMHWLTFLMANQNPTGTVSPFAMRMFGKENQLLSEIDFDTDSQYFYSELPYTSSLQRVRFPLGGSGTTWRVRVSSTPITDNFGADSNNDHENQPKAALPTNESWSIVEWVAEWVETDAR